MYKLSPILPSAPSAETRQEGKKEKDIKRRKEFQIYTRDPDTDADHACFLCAYIKLHHEPLIFRLHSLLRDGVRQVLQVRRLLRLQRLLHLLLHLSLSCCFGLCLSLSPHLLQPSKHRSQFTTSSYNIDASFVHFIRVNN